MSELVPPHSIDAEQALLGAVFIDNDVMTDALKLVGDFKMFYRAAHQFVYSAMIEMHVEHAPIDWVTLSERLAAKGTLEAVGGAQYLEEITAMTPMSSGAEQYAEIVRDNWIRRETIAATSAAQSAAFNSSVSMEDVRKYLRDTADKVEGVTKRQMPDMKDTVAKVRETVREVLATGSIPSWNTGNRTFDLAMLGWQVGGITALSALSGGGKTFNALSLVQLFQEANVGVRAGIISLEMMAEELIERTLVHDQFFREVLNGNIQQSRVDSVRRRLDAYESSPYQIVTPDERKVDDICTLLRSMAQRGIKFIVIDYIGLMDFGSRPASEIGDAALGKIKAVAQSSRIHVVILSQLAKSTVAGRSMLEFEQSWLYGGLGSALEKASHTVHGMMWLWSERDNPSTMAKINNLLSLGWSLEEVKRITIQKCVKGRRGMDRFWVFWETDDDLVLREISDKERVQILTNVLLK